MAEVWFYIPTKTATSGALSTSNDGSGNFTEILSGSAMGFGYNSSAWPNNILKDSTARYANILDSPTQGDNKSQQAKHISVGNHDDSPDAVSVYYRSCGPTGANGVVGPHAIGANGYDNSSPKAWETNRMIFTHGSNVQIDSIDVWISSGAGGTVEFTYASAWIMESTPSGTQDWATAKPNNKMSFTAQSSVTDVHMWNYGLSMVPHTEAVGFCDWGYLQVSITYS
jgi:hypothetical protein